MAADKPPDASEFLRAELHSVVKRYSEISVYQVLGVLQAVQMDLWDMLERHHHREDETRDS